MYLKFLFEFEYEIKFIWHDNKIKNKKKIDDSEGLRKMCNV